MLRSLRALSVALLPLVALAAPAFGQSLTFSMPERAYHVWFNDFDNFEADQWIVTEVGSGTRAIADADGGVLVITNAATDNDHNFLQWSGDDDTGTQEGWTFTAGKAMLIQARFKVSDATQSDFVFGLQITDTAPLAATDGIWFGKDDADALLDVHIAAASSQTNTTGVFTVVDDTYMTLALYYNGSDASFKAYVNGNTVGEIALTNAPTTELTISFGHQDGEAEAQVMSVDYIGVWKAR